MRFAIREGGKTVGAGVVTKILAYFIVFTPTLRRGGVAFSLCPQPQPENQKGRVNKNKARGKKDEKVQADAGAHSGKISAYDHKDY